MRDGDQGRLQEELKARADAAEVLVVEVDGSMLPIRGEEPWREAKVGLTYRHDARANAPIPSTARYLAVVGGLGNFAPVLEEALEVENIDEVGKVVWVGDGAPATGRSPNSSRRMRCRSSICTTRSSTGWIARRCSSVRRARGFPSGSGASKRFWAPATLMRSSRS